MQDNAHQGLVNSLVDFFRAIVKEELKAQDPLVRLNRRERKAAKSGDLRDAYRDGKAYLARQSDVDAWRMRCPVRVVADEPEADDFDAFASRPSRLRSV